MYHGINRRVPTAYRKQGKWQKNQCQGKHMESGHLLKTLDMCTQGVIFFYSDNKGYNFDHGIFLFFSWKRGIQNEILVGILHQ